MINCKQCNKETNNKMYCSRKCRYKNSHFKNFTWNSVENLNKSYDHREIFNNAHKKSRNTVKEKYKKGIIKIWNKGLTKNDNETLLKFSQRMSGKNNIVHKILADPIKAKEYKKNLSNGIKNSNKKCRDTTFEDFYGIEKAIKYKQNLSIAAKKRLIHGHTGKTHSEESKNKMRIATVNNISAGKYNLYTKPMKIFYEILKILKFDKYFEKEFNIKFYSIDFASDKFKIAFEIDGDFWHVNPIKFPNGPKYNSQKKNLEIQKKKEIFLENEGWKLYRIWENDLINNYENTFNKIKIILNEIIK